MKKLLLSLLCISMILSMFAGCSNSVKKDFKDNLPSIEVNSNSVDNNKEDILYDAETIESKYQNSKTGYLQITDAGISFREAEFDYDDKAILYVKKYIDADFIKYDTSENIEIYLIDFDDYITKFKKVDFEFFRNNFNNYCSRPYHVEINNGKILAVIEMYIP